MENLIMLFKAHILKYFSPVTIYIHQFITYIQFMYIYNFYIYRELEINLYIYFFSPDPLKSCIDV